MIPGRKSYPETLRILEHSFCLWNLLLRFWERLGDAPHPVRVTIRDNKDYIRALFDSYHTTITGRGVLLT